VDLVPFLQVVPAAPVARPEPPTAVLEYIPDVFEVTGNFPNPFNPTTTIEFTLSEASLVTMRIYNVVGEEVAAPLLEEPLDEGSSSVEFEASGLPSGVYFYRITFDQLGSGEARQITGRMVFAK
jgi:hypothetical protein